MHLGACCPLLSRDLVLDMQLIIDDTLPPGSAAYLAQRWQLR